MLQVNKWVCFRQSRTIRVLQNWKGPESSSLPVLNIYSDVRRVELSAMVENVCPKTPWMYRAHGISSPRWASLRQAALRISLFLHPRAFPSCQVSSFHSADLPFSFARWPSGTFILQAGSRGSESYCSSQRAGNRAVPCVPSVSGTSPPPRVGSEPSLRRWIRGHPHSWTCPLPLVVLCFPLCSSEFDRAFWGVLCLGPLSFLMPH